MTLTLFKVNNDASMNGTHLMGYVRARYSDLVKLLGEPEIGDEYKVSGIWVLTDFLGNTVTLYDWKCTQLYESDLPTVEQFRKNKNTVTFNVGGRDENIVKYFICDLSHALDNIEGV